MRSETRLNAFVHIVVIACVLTAGEGRASQKLADRSAAAPVDRKEVAAPSAVVQGTEIPPAKIALPGTPAARRLEAEYELVKLGLIPVHHLGPKNPHALYSPRPKPVPADVGTTIVTHPDATGDLLALQKEIAATLSRQNHRPAARTAHFQWLDRHPLLVQKKVRFIGWHGGIIDVRRSAKDAWLVKVHMYPWLYSPSMRTEQPDHVVEIYEYSHGVAKLIESDAELPKPALQIFPPLSR